MKRQAPFLLLISALVLTAILVSMTVSFAVALLIPPPEWPPMNFPEAIAALRDPAAAERSGLRRAHTCVEPEIDPDDTLSARVVAAELGITEDQVRVGRASYKPTLIISTATKQRNNFHFIDFGKNSRSDLDDSRRILMSADMTVPAFHLSLRQADGCWLTVAPSNKAVQDWRLRIFVAFFLCATLLMPMVWWMARRLSGPLKRLALEATRVSLDDRDGPIPLEGAHEVRMAAAAMNAMQERLRAQADDMIQMLAAVAHDLRTPLTGLRLRAESAPDAARDRMAADIRRMDAMITQVLDYAQGRYSPDAKTWIDLAALIRESIASAEAAGDDVRERLLSPMHAFVEPGTLRRALDNLIGNAVRYAGRARVSLTIERSTIVIQVDDDGPGIPEDQLRRVQEPFRRLETSRNRETGGTGLGLAIARAAARRSGGRLVLRNRPEGGLSARIELPLP